MGVLTTELTDLILLELCVCVYASTDQMSSKQWLNKVKTMLTNFYNQEFHTKNAGASTLYTALHVRVDCT